MTHRFWSIVLGLLLLAWGLSMLGVPVPQMGHGLWGWLARLWPLILVVWGGRHVLQGLTGPRRGQGLVFGGAMLGLGLGLLAERLDAPFAASAWAGLLMGAGIGLLLKAMVQP